MKIRFQASKAENNKSASKNMSTPRLTGKVPQRLTAC